MEPNKPIWKTRPCPVEGEVRLTPCDATELRGRDGTDMPCDATELTGRAMPECHLSTPTTARDGGRCVSLGVGAQVAMAAWFDDRDECWADSGRRPVKVTLPWQDVIGLESACNNGGFGAVWLFVYGHQNIENVPSKVMQRDAHEFLEWEEAQAMHERGVPVAHLSAIVRIRAAVREGGVVLDSNLWVIRPFPRSPFVAASWGGHGLLNTPFGVLPRPSRLAIHLEQLVDGFKETFTNKKHFNLDQDWNLLMHGIRDIFDMGCEARPPIEFPLQVSIEFGASLPRDWHRKKLLRSHDVEPIP